MTDKRRPASLSGKECSPKVWWGFPSGSGVKNLLTNAGDSSLIPGLRRSPGEGNGNPCQCSCLGDPMDRGTCWSTAHGVTKESKEQ